MEPSSKRRKEAPLKLNQLQSNEQQPVMAVTPTVRAVQPPQAHVQRLGAATGLMSLTNRQQQLQSQLQQKQQQLRQKQQEIGQKQQQIQRQQQQIQQQQLQLQQQEQQIQQLQREIMRQRDQIQLQQEQVTVPVPVAQPSRQIQASAESNIEDSESIAYLQKEIHFPHRAIVQRQVTGDEVKMLVIAGNGTQSLITFAVPIEDCTVGQLIEQAHLTSSVKPHVSLVSDPALGINYIIDCFPSSVNTEEEAVESIPAEQANVAAHVGEPKTAHEERRVRS